MALSQPKIQKDPRALAMAAASDQLAENVKTLEEERDKAMELVEEHQKQNLALTQDLTKAAERISDLEAEIKTLKKSTAKGKAKK